MFKLPDIGLSDTAGRGRNCAIYRSQMYFSNTLLPNQNGNLSPSSLVHPMTVGPVLKFGEGSLHALNNDISGFLREFM